MKRSVLLILALALLLAAAALAPVFKEDPGLVQIHFGQWTMETSVLVLVGAFLLLWLVIPVSYTHLTLPTIYSV